LKFIKEPIDLRNPLVALNCEEGRVKGTNSGSTGRLTDPEEPKPLYHPYPADLMEMCPVSPFVNNPRNESPACIEPLQA
jgi:hypothetical protein